MVGPSVITATASPVNKVQRDRRIDIEIDPPAHNISGPNGWVKWRPALGRVWDGLWRADQYFLICHLGRSRQVQSIPLGVSLQQQY
jgi:hypothetical protein